MHVSKGMNRAGAAGARALSGALDRPVARVLLVLLFSMLTWAGARVSVPLPFTPVPGTLQTLSVLLAGAILGARAGAASQAAYILMGIAGLPVFALPGAGPGYLLGPTGGYLVGFVPAAFLVGSLLGRVRGRSAPLRALAFASGAATIHLCGLAWLTVVLGDGGAALRAGVLPFILFDLAKVVVATGIHTGLIRWTRITRT